MSSQPIPCQCLISRIGDLYSQREMHKKKHVNRRFSMKSTGRCGLKGVRDDVGGELLRRWCVCFVVRLEMLLDVIGLIMCPAIELVLVR